MLSEIRHALKTGNVGELYERISGKKIDYNCGQCIADAKIYLQTKANELEREFSPIHLYLINPSEETLWQNQQNTAFSKIEIVAYPEQAFVLFEDEVVNVIAQDVFFDSTICKVKQIKPYQAYALDFYKWDGNGKAVLQSNSPCAWVFRGKAKKSISDLSGLSRLGYVVSNPFQDVHALRLIG